MPAAPQASSPWLWYRAISGLSKTSTMTGPRRAVASTIGDLIAFERRGKSRDTPIENPVAGTSSAAEAADEPIIAASTADRPEADRLAVVAEDLEGQLGFEDRARIIFEAAHDGRIDH